MTSLQIPDFLDRVDDRVHFLRVYLGLVDYDLLHVIADVHALHVGCGCNDGVFLM